MNSKDLQGLQDLEGSVNNSSEQDNLVILKTGMEHHRKRLKHLDGSYCFPFYSCNLQRLKEIIISL